MKIVGVEYENGNFEIRDLENLEEGWIAINKAVYLEAML